MSQPDSCTADIAVRHYRRNLGLVVADHIVYTLGMTFLGAATILPALVLRLGGGPLAVGMMSTLQAAGWVLPQLVASRYMAGRALVKRTMLGAALVARAALWLALPALVLLGPAQPGVALAALLLCTSAFTLLDSFSITGWFEILHKLVPADQRGRVIGGAQSLANLVSLGAGFLVQLLLAAVLPFPLSYAAVLALSATFYSIDAACLGLLREPPSRASEEQRLPWQAYASRLRRILRSDRRFTWLVVVSWLMGMADMAAAFYAVYATGPMGLPPEFLGLLITASVAGGMVGSAAMGALGDRKGWVWTVRAVTVVRCLCPALALLAPLAAGLVPWAGALCFVAAFALMGLLNAANYIVLTNYLLHIAPAGQGAVYVALHSALQAPRIVAPLMAGWMVQALSFPILFMVSLALGLGAVAASARSPRGPAAKVVDLAAT